MQTTLNPTGRIAESHVPLAYIQEMLGLIPFFATVAEADAENAAEFKKAMEAEYGFPLATVDGTVDEQGIFKSKYEEDPELIPLAKMDTPHVTLYQYQYAIVAFVNKDGSPQFVTRMD